MNDEEYEMASLKRKSRQADNIMLSNANGVEASAYMNDDEGSQLVMQGQPGGLTPGKGRGAFNMDDSDEDAEGGSYSGGQKRLLNESDFEMNEKKQNIPTPGKNSDDMFSFLETDASMQSVDAFVGPVKTEFEDLKRKIEAKDRELEQLETDFYKRVSSKAVELEGIGPE